MIKGLVTVLLTTYNRPVFLKEAIDSVLNQTYDNYELFLIDDDSDNPEQIDIIKSYWHHPKVWIIKSHVPLGTRIFKCRYAHMINEGFKLAHGEFVSYLCDDDFYYPNRLGLMVMALNKNPDWQIVYGKQERRYYNKEGVYEEHKTDIRPMGGVETKEATFNVDHSSILHRMSLYEKIGPWPDDPVYWNAADAEYWRRIAEAGVIFYPINEVTDCHRYHHGRFTQNNWEKLV